MNAHNNNTAPGGFRAWWASPPRSGLQRFINPWEFRHLRFFGSMRMAGGCVAAFPALVCLAYGAYGWAAFFGAIAALNLAGGCWFLNIANNAPAQS